MTDMTVSRIVDSNDPNKQHRATCGSVFDADYDPDKSAEGATYDEAKRNLKQMLRTAAAEEMQILDQNRNNCGVIRVRDYQFKGSDVFEGVVWLTKSQTAKVKAAGKNSVLFSETSEKFWFPVNSEYFKFYTD